MFILGRIEGKAVKMMYICMILAQKCQDFLFLRCTMKIFNTKGFQILFDRTIASSEDGGVGLMERIASSVSCEIISRWLPKKRFVLFAGPGSNGCIALAVARMLIEQGYRLEVFLFNVPSMPISEDCNINKERLLAIEGVDFTEVKTTFELPYISADDVVIDGLFGTGLTAPLKGGFTMLVQGINESNAYVVAIDMPSGLLAEWNHNNDRRNIIKADLTLAFKFKRLSFFFAENAEYVGTCKVLDIDFDAETIRKTPSSFYLVEEADVRRRLRKRKEFSNKYDYGTLLLAAGSYGKMGAALLSAKAALRSGAGRLTVHAPRCGYSVLPSSVPEAISQYDNDSTIITDVRLDRNYSAIAIGPGIGTKDDTINAVDSLMKRYNRPCILDADALNCISLRPGMLDSIPKMSVITPHAGEFDRLFGNQMNDESRLREAIKMSRRYGIVIVLKGRYTMVIRPDEKVYINSTGSPALATPGSGDVLTGLIGGFAAQGYEMELCAAMGAFIHGAAGDRAEKTLGSYSETASDIIDNIGPVIKEIMSRNETK